jgi:alkaline phosphatase
VGYNPSLGGLVPWIPLTPADPGSYNVEYIKCSYPDSANTATTLYTGVKSYNNAMGVDIYEQNLVTILQAAAAKGKSTGVVTSVPITHATPGAAVSSVNRRNKYDNDFPALDNILQEAISPPGVGNNNSPLYLPTVMLGGGHPLDHENTGSAGPVNNYTYIKQSTYDHLRQNPNSNRYGYRFLERGSSAAATLLSTADSINPNAGGRLLGLYGARGQNGNLPVSTANGDYSLTGLSNFSLTSSVTAASIIPTPDTVRPLSPSETDASFIAREINENPTLADLSLAALKVLGKDADGFWLMIEGGDIDWAAHDNNMDNLIGTVNDFDKAVGKVIDWIKQNGGWQKNALIVTADHDHYLTLNSNFPQKLAQYSAEGVTFNQHTPAEAGHFWGSDPNYKYGWGTHTNRPVPVYYQGKALNLEKYFGKGYSAYGFNVPGIPGLIDQSHIYQGMLDVINQ